MTPMLADVARSNNSGSGTVLIIVVTVAVAVVVLGLVWYIRTHRRR
jgi:hypothetical protein